MFPPGFDYRRAGSLEEAVSLVADGAVPLAGGHGLLPDVKAGEAAPDRLVDVGDVDALAGIEADGDGVRVGALATHADLVASGPVAARVPALAATARHVGDPQIRNRGTVGGNLAEADPAADLPAAVLAADATIDAVGPDGERSLPATDFFAGDGATALGADELLAAVRVPAHAGGAYVKATHPATGYAMVGVAAVASVDDGVVADAGVAATGVADRPVRLREVETAIEGSVVTDVDAAAAADAAGDAPAPERRRGDAHASAAYRASVLPTYVERAVDAALPATATGGAST